MSGPQALLTPETAPRSLEALMPLGIYQHRRLAEELEGRGVKIFETDKDKAAFFGANSEVRAQRLLEALSQFDGGKPAAAPTRTPVVAPQAAPAPAPATTAAPVVQAPAAATTRQPRSQANGAAGAAQPVAQVAGPNPGVEQLLLALKGVQDTLGALKSHAETVSGNQAGLGNGLGALDQRISAIADKVDGLAGLIHANMKIAEVQLGLLALFGEQVLGAPKEAFLPDAVKTATDALTALEGKG